MSYLFLSESRPISRKDRPCIWCPEQILAGERYVKVSGVFDGDFQLNNFHPECYEASQKDFRESGEDEFSAHECQRGTNLPASDTRLAADAQDTSNPKIDSKPKVKTAA